MSETIITEKPPYLAYPHPGTGELRFAPSYIYSRREPLHGEGHAPGLRPYAIGFPDEGARNGIRYASSFGRVPIIISGSHEEAWERALARADTWRIPKDLLLRDRPVKIAYTKNANPYPSRLGREPFLYHLLAIAIGGDFAKFEALEERISEIKGLFA